MVTVWFCIVNPLPPHMLHLPTGWQPLPPHEPHAVSVICW